MKVGMNLLLWTGAVSDEHLPLLKEIQEWGADGVEVPMFDTAGSDWAKIGKACDDLGLGRTTVVVLPPGANLIGDEAGERQAAVDFLKGCVDACQTLGAEAIGGPIYSPVGRLVGRPPTDDERKRAIEGLRAVGEHAQGSGVRLAVEPLNRFETYFLNTQKDTNYIVDQVGLDTVQQMYDTFHANIEEKDPAGAIKVGGKRIIHVHVCACDRGTPGDDHIDYEAAFQALHDIGYDGWLTIEAFGHRIPELAAATCIWRQISPDEAYVVREGVKMIKELW